MHKQPHSAVIKQGRSSSEVMVEIITLDRLHLLTAPASNAGTEKWFIPQLTARLVSHELYWQER